MQNSEPWLEDPLGYIIGAERVASFHEKIYEREALVVHHNAPERFRGLISIADIDRIVTGFDLKRGQLAMADASREMSEDEYVDAAGFIDRGAVSDLYRRGATIIMNQAHQLEPPLAQLCRGLEQTFSSHIQTNLYLTPPSAQGFRTHYDNHDVLVIQIEGEKAWRLYEKPVDTPFRGENFESGKHPSGELKQEFLLKAGDCAYVPRGLMHDAQTSGDAPSLHVTVGLITRTWADLILEAVSEAALRSPELRRSLPAGFARRDFDRTAARTHLAKLAADLARDIQLDPAMDLLADTFTRSRGAANRGSILSAGAAPQPGELFKAHDRVPFRIAEDGDSVVVICPGGELTFPSESRADIECALSGKLFTLGDLKGEKPEGMMGTFLAYGLIVRD
ncbi:MAG: hypothetical protein DCF16_03395 [Alphaproteobacteria bacterium]|nr:MAG: hypothetical protein DCF16_03395 [Alphaproteobacteria bacterium]